MKNKKQQLNGLPNYFKKIGVGLFLMSISLIFLLGYIGLEKELSIKIIFPTMILSGVLFILAEEKLEDERIERARLIAFRSSFLFTIFYAIWEMWIIDEVEVINIVLTSILIYIVAFQTQKRKL